MPFEMHILQNFNTRIEGNPDIIFFFMQTKHFSLKFEIFHINLSHLTYLMYNAFLLLKCFFLNNYNNLKLIFHLYHDILMFFNYANNHQ